MFFRFLPDIDIFNLPVRQKSDRLLPVPDTRQADFTTGNAQFVQMPKQAGEVGVTWDKVRSETGGRQAELTPLDEAYLNAYFEDGPDKWDRVIAAVIKKDWATLDSAGAYLSSQTIAARHTVNGVTEKGYSLRQIKKYTKQFNASHAQYLNENPLKK
jgi:hypothetical protein